MSRNWEVLDYKKRFLGGTTGKDLNEAVSNMNQAGPSFWGGAPAYLKSDKGELFSKSGTLIDKSE